MMDEERTRVIALMEDLGRQIGVMAESQEVLREQVVALDRKFTQRFEDLELQVVGLTIEVRDLKADVRKLEARFDRLEVRFDRLEAKVDKLEEFAADAGPRLVRIETHLKLNKPLPARDATRAEPSRHHRRKSAKRT